MAKKDIDVSTDGISQTRDAATDVYHDTLVAQFRDMTAAVEELNATWQGPNHDAFVKSYNARKKAIDTFHNALSSYLRAWGDAFYEYNECESSVAAQIK